MSDAPAENIIELHLSLRKFFRPNLDGAFLLLLRKGGMSFADAMDLLSITKANLAHLSAGLIKKGFVEKRESPKDKRKKIYFLTDAGREKADTLATELNERLKRALADNPDASECFREAAKILSFL